MTHIAHVYPRLLNDAVFLPSGGGAFFRNDGTTFALTEPGTFELMCRIAPELTGRRSVEDICTGFDPCLHVKVEWLVDQLLRGGIVRDERDRHHVQLAPALATRFASQLALLDHLADAPEEAFAKFRGSPVLLVGSGVSFWHCAHALVSNGLERLWVLELAGTGEGMVPVQEQVTALQALGITADVRAAEVESNLSLNGPDQIALMLCVADVVLIPALVLMARWALRYSCPIIPGFAIADQTLMGPIVRAPGCPACTLSRVAREMCDPQQARRFAEAMEEGSGRLGRLAPDDEPLFHRLGGDVAFEAFKTLAGRLRPDLERGLILQTVNRAGSVGAGFVPYTLHGCWGFCRRFVRRTMRPPTDAAHVSWSTSDHLGPLFRTPVEAGPC